MSEKVFVSTVSAGGARKLLRMIKFIFISYVVSLMLIAVLSALVVYTDIPEKYAPAGVGIITYFACFLSGLMTAKASISKGWLVGGVSGVCNIIILAVIAMAIVGVGPFGTKLIFKLLIGAVCGAIGGMLGINTKRE